MCRTRSLASSNLNGVDISQGRLLYKNIKSMDGSEPYASAARIIRSRRTPDNQQPHMHHALQPRVNSRSKAFFCTAAIFAYNADFAYPPPDQNIASSHQIGICKRTCLRVFAYCVHSFPLKPDAFATPHPILTTVQIGPAIGLWDRCR